VLIALFLQAQTVRAQAGAAAAAAPAAQTATQTPAQPAAETDPLGRDTPRGTVLGFMDAARTGKTEVTPLYLDTNLSGQAARDLANQLYVVLDGHLPVRLSQLSDRPEGTPDNPLQPDLDVIGTINTKRGSFNLVLERVTRRGSKPAWLFSRQTLALIPEAYSEVNLVVIDRYLPGFLTKFRIAGIRLFEWLGLLLVLPFCYVLFGSLNWLFRPVAARWHRRFGDPREKPADHLPGLFRLVVLAIAIRWVLATIDLPLLERQFWTTAAALMLIVSAGWLLLLVNAYGEGFIRRRFGVGSELASLLRVVRRFADVLVIAASILVALRYFGFDPSAALAGLGIGGIAVALAAQKTLENIIAGLSLIFDKAVRVGDTLKFGTTVGTVDYIGLRSTRIRTLDRTILTVPNGQIASVGIETLSDRDKFWFHHFVGLRYETTAAQLRKVIDGVQKLLAAHKQVDESSVRVRFIRLGAFSLDLEISAYVFTRDGDGFLEVQQELLLRIMEAVDAAGAVIAIPSQTLHIAEGRLPDNPASDPRAQPASLRTTS
jgi:MscS family membrane protein